VPPYGGNGGKCSTERAFWEGFPCCHGPFSDSPDTLFPHPARKTLDKTPASAKIMPTGMQQLNGRVAAESHRQR